MEGFLQRRWSPLLIRCVGTPPARLLVYPLPGCLWLYELHGLSTISQCEEMIVTIMRGCADPREKSDIVRDLSGFLKLAQHSTSSHGGAALMPEP